ncbi:glycosyltransferase 87 family protein [Kutzneria sp. NPDC052558]|uniref:glycosyltransferase 87 family protein n=1 Tax=Kutzneria sp. NPDC052558 TaxID=3364121 RepID=UPI0037CA6FC9
MSDVKTTRGFWARVADSFLPTAGAKVLPLPAWLRRATPWVIAVILLWFVVCTLIWPVGMWMQIDLEVYRAGGLTVLDGRPLYDHPLVASLMFTYTPFAAIIFAPLALLPLVGTEIVYTVVTLLLLLFAIARCWRWLGYRRDRASVVVVLLCTGLALMFEPVRTTFYLGQINVLLLAIVVGDLLRTRKSNWTGIGVGIAAGIKLTPLIFIPYLLVTRQFKAAGVATASFVGTIALGFVIKPGDAYAYWLGQKFSEVSRVGDVWSTGNQSLRGFLARLVSPPEATQNAWVLLAAVFGILGLAAAVLAHRRGEELLAVSLIGMCSTAVSPYSWSHHWVWFVPLFVFALNRALTTGRAAMWALATYVLVAVFAWPVAFPVHDPGARAAAGIWMIDWPGDVVTRNNYIIAYLVIAVFTLVHLRRSNVVTSTDGVIDSRNPVVSR